MKNSNMNYYSNIKSLFIANDTYGEGITPLAGAVRITTELYNYFIKEICENDNDAKLLCNKENTCAINEMNKFIEKTSVNFSDNDVFFFYFCGHGHNSKLKNELIMAMADTSEHNKDSVGIRFDDITWIFMYIYLP